MNPFPLLLAGGVIATVLLFSRKATAATGSTNPDEPTFIFPFGETDVKELKRYATTTDGIANEAKFAPIIAGAESQNGIPAGVLHRLIYQESRFRSDIIDGRTVSSAGAIGIAQIVPKWHPGVNPRDPIQSIQYAARYLASQRDRFGNWRLALAAYNWGPGNLAKDTSGLTWPKETRDYVAQIANDTGLA